MALAYHEAQTSDRGQRRNGRKDRLPGLGWLGWLWASQRQTSGKMMKHGGYMWI